MSFFRNIRSSLSSSSRAKSSSSRDTTPVRSQQSSRPASVISVGRASSSRRDSTTSSTLQRGDTFILPETDEEANNSTLEKKSKKSKVFGKFSTFTKRKKTPSGTPAEEEVASYEHHPSDTATNTYYKWRSDGGDRLQDYDAQSDPFNFLYEQQSSLRNLQSGESSVQRQASIGSNSSGSFDSSTYRKSKTPTHLREQLEQLKTHSNDDLLEDQQREEDEREKYKTVTLNSFRKSFRERLLQQQKEAPHNPAWFVEVPPPPTPDPRKTNGNRWDCKENRPDFLVFENDNYRPQSRSPLRDRPSRSATRSPVKRNETFRVAQPSLRHMSPSPAPSIRIEIKNSISPHSPGRFVPVGVAKPMPTTEYYAQRLLASSNHNHGRLAPAPASAPRTASPSASQRWYRPQSSPTRLQATRMSVDPQQSPRLGVPQQQPSRMSHQLSTRMSLGQQQPSRMSVEQQHQHKGGRTLVHIGSDQSRAQSSANPMPARGRAPTRVQLYGNKPQSTRQQPQLPSSTYFGGHYNAPATSNAGKQRGSSSGLGVATVYGGGVPTVYLGRREQPMTRAPRNRSPIKMPWR
ncbi:serine/arginine repetitive matrix protein 1 [Drosophila guanche]|uniref:serine/arginine repetitive matrix protein 1 n=1 Tax=Drosophila guanche TaxID=7266 RepID=UPI001471CC6F|nr:serine/arginine repetitive matrix protein 1 [Drosophila guanche]